MKKNIWVYLFIGSFLSNIFLLFCSNNQVLKNNSKVSYRLNGPINGKENSHDMIISSIKKKTTTNARDKNSGVCPPQGEQSSTRSYEKLEDAAQKHLETFIVNELGLNPQNYEYVVQLINKTNLHVDKYFADKGEQIAQRYGRSDGYMPSPDDFLVIGKLRLQTRKKIKSYLGEEKYSALINYFEDYKYGIYGEPVMPIQF